MSRAVCMGWPGELRLHGDDQAIPQWVVRDLRMGSDSITQGGRWRSFDRKCIRACPEWGVAESGITGITNSTDPALRSAPCGLRLLPLEAACYALVDFPPSMTHLNHGMGLVGSGVIAGLFKPHIGVSRLPLRISAK